MSFPTRWLATFAGTSIASSSAIINRQVNKCIQNKRINQIVKTATYTTETTTKTADKKGKDAKKNEKKKAAKEENVIASTEYLSKAASVAILMNDFEFINVMNAEKNLAGKTLRRLDFYALKDESWKKCGGDKVVLQTAKYYKIFPDLLTEPVTPMLNFEVKFDYINKDGDSAMFMTGHGKIIPPSFLTNEPKSLKVNIPSESKSKYSVVCVSPDDNVFVPASSYMPSLRWMVTNLTSSEIKSGTTICKYIPPTPAQDCGIMRYVYFLCKQDTDLKQVNVNGNEYSELQPYSDFSFENFVQQNKLTVEGYSFHQSSWDPSVTATYATFLGMKEPLYVLAPNPQAPGKRFRRNKTSHGDKKKKW